MIQWTETAKRTLDDYCVRSKAVLAGSGVDAEEVSDDLRRHVEEEVRTARLSVVSEDDVRRILARVGEPGTPVEERSCKPATTLPPPGTQTDDKKSPGLLLLVLGVILPLGTLIFELVTGISAGVLFDPIPSWFSILAVALVPGANFWIWWAGRARDARPARWLGWLNGAALGVCIYYSLMYLLFVPYAAIGVLYFGLGLIPLTPHLALIATPFLRAAYIQRIGKAQLPGGWGVLVGFGFLVLLQLPAALTYYGLAQASAEESDASIHGVRVLRTFGDDELVLRACYGLLRREVEMDWVRMIASGNKTVSAEQAREIYYRVNGKSFNSLPPPSLYTRAGRWTALDEEFTWDDALGGEAVAGRVKGLSLLSSRMDAVAEPDAALVYCEWTMEFKNVSRQQREARMQIALPPGAVVSRLTLWINGEEREAAFGGRSQVRAAYQEVAVVKRRDPVLVTTCGPDRVLVQCFPVPPNGGVMKVRLGMTSPLAMESLDQGSFRWPRFLERNYGIVPDFKHTLWIESPTRLNHQPAANSAQAGQHPFAYNESVSDADLSAAPRTVRIHRSPKIETVWTPTDEKGLIIRQSIQPVPAVFPSRVVVVVDGSGGMQSVAKDLGEALAGISETTEIALIVANEDQRVSDAKPQKATPEVVKALRQRLGKTRFFGGQDNLPALETAWDLAAQVDNGVVVWIHQPQAVLLSSESGLRQRIERTPTPVRLFELQIRNGPDRLIEKLDGLSPVEHVVRLGSLRSDFQKLLAQWAGKQGEFKFVREKTTEPAMGTPVGKHIERLWARDEALRLAAHRQRDEGVKLASANQLVTPVTGAVVLETKDQYDRHGLKPADAMTVPAVPEPTAMSLVGVAFAVYFLSRRNRRQSRQHHNK